MGPRLLPTATSPRPREPEPQPEGDHENDHRRHETALVRTLAWMRRFEILARITGLLFFQIAAAVAVLGSFALVFPAATWQARPGFPCHTVWAPDVSLLVPVASTLFVYCRYERPLLARRRHPESRCRDRPFRELVLLLVGLLAHLPVLGLACVCQDPSEVLTALFTTLIITFLCAEVAFICRGNFTLTEQFTLINGVWVLVFVLDLIFIFVQPWGWSRRLLLGFYTTVGLIFAGHLSQQVLLARHVTVPRDVACTSLQLFITVISLFLLLLRIRNCEALLKDLGLEPSPPGAMTLQWDDARSQNSSPSSSPSRPSF